jgi:hypothetical protein
VCVAPSRTCSRRRRSESHAARRIGRLLRTESGPLPERVRPGAGAAARRAGGPSNRPALDLIALRGGVRKSEREQQCTKEEEHRECDYGDQDAAHGRFD